MSGTGRMRRGKPEVSLDERGLRVGGDLRPLVAGQFEYWRHHSLHWEPILRLMRESGLEFVATFVCWDFHEVEPGDFDFEGRTHPSRNLAGFIDFCADAGLGVLLRTGPVIDAEWPTRGPAPDIAPLERLNPRFMERTQEYVRALAPIIAPRLITNGGPITLLSIDNEVYFPYSTNETSDPSAGSMHVPYDRDLVIRRYRTWLADRYGGPNGIQAAWSRPVQSLEEVDEPDYPKAGLRETLDSFEFITHCIQEIFERQKAMYMDIGVDVPLYTNMKQFTYYIDWKTIENVVNSHGLNLHMPQGWPGDGKLVASWYCRILRSRMRFPWAPEFQGGTPLRPPGEADRIRGSAEDARVASMFAMALGLRGLCYYMFVERDDFPPHAPLSPIGKVRPQFYGLKEAIAVLRQLTPDRHVTEVGLLWSIDHHRTFVASQYPDWVNLYDMWIDFDGPKEMSPWWEVFRILHDEDIDFDIVPLDQSLGGYKALIYSGQDFVRVADLESMVAWVKEGGRLITTTSLPSRAVPGEDQDIFDQLASILRRSPNMLWGSSRHLPHLLDSTGVRSAIRSETPHVWTFAYRRADGWVLFVANAGTDPSRASVKLGPQLMDEVHGTSAVDLLSGEAWKVTAEELWPDNPTLAPNEVRCIRIMK